MRSHAGTASTLTYAEKLQLRLIFKADRDVEHYDTIPARVLIALRLAESIWSETKSCYLLRITSFGREVAATIGSIGALP